mmetsp:Transcript_21690/g.55225  ORF Transcript_21690/g.55225 Transcript_21690/m.55225 type:complete len:404 (+) Transcript_21690:483-1694(+)
MLVPCANNRSSNQQGRGCSQDDGGLGHRLLDLLVRQDDRAVHVQLVLALHVLAQHAVVLQPRPRAHPAVPPHDAVVHLGVVLDGHALHDDTVGQAHARADDAARADRHVGADEAAGPDLGGGVHQHVAAVLGPLGQRVALVDALRVEVQAQALEVVLGLAHVHPVAAQRVRVQPVVRRDVREHLALDGGRAQLNAVEHLGGAHVDAGVDLVAHKVLGLLHEALHLPVLVHHHHAVLGGVVHLGHQDGGLRVACDVEVQHLLQRVLADHVTVEHKEGLALPIIQQVACKCQGASSAHGLLLLGAYNLDTKLLLPLVDEVVHHLRLIVDGQHYLVHSSALQRLNLVHDHGDVRKLDQRLGTAEGQGAEASAIAAHKNQSLQVCCHGCTLRRTKLGHKPGFGAALE